MAYISKIVLFFISFFLLFEGKAQFVSYQIGYWKVEHYVGIKQSKFIKIFPRYNSPMTLDRLYSFFCPQILGIEESSDGIYVHVINSLEPPRYMIYQIPPSLFDTNYCVFDEEGFLYNDSIFYSGFVSSPLNNVRALSGKPYFYKRLKITNQIDSYSEKCVMTCRLKSNKCHYVIVLLHDDYELVNVIKISKLKEILNGWKKDLGIDGL